MVGYLIFAGLLSSLAVRALNPILVKSNVFYDSVTQERLFLYGVDYQPGGEQGIDPLHDPQICARDVFLLQKLGANVLRVYTVDNSLDHDECMSMYNAAGIYLMLDVNSARPDQHLNRDEPWTTYTKAYAEHVFKTVTVFSGYDNVIGFFSGNELINSNVSAMASPPYLKAITRDMKAYIAKHLHRPLAIGYSAADNIEYRMETAQYMSCGTADDGINDFYAINSYQWCGTQTIHTSGYDQIIEQFKNFTLPLFFSETGCNLVTPRQFGEIEAIFGPEMTETFSGCLVYEFSEEPNRYGLAKINAKDGSVKEMRDYGALAGKYANLPSLPKDLPTEARAHPSCPDPSSFRAINGADKLPSLPEIEALIQSGVSATPGKFRAMTSLPATDYTIYDASGNEIQDKAATVKSGVNGKLPDLRPLLQAPGYAPTAASLSAGSAAAAAAAADTSDPSPSASAGSRLSGLSLTTSSQHFIVMVMAALFVMN